MVLGSLAGAPASSLRAPRTALTPLTAPQPFSRHHSTTRDAPALPGARGARRKLGPSAAGAAGASSRLSPGLGPGSSDASSAAPASASASATTTAALPSSLASAEVVSDTGSPTKAEPLAQNGHIAAASEAPAGQPQNPLPVEVVRLEPQQSVPAAVAVLRAALEARDARAAAPPPSSGLLRLEVPLPRSVLALDWLRGQPRAPATVPRFYYSPRKFASPGGEGSAAAEACVQGLGSVAGVGASRRWQGQPGERLSDTTLSDMRRHLRPSHPLLRVFGALRFNEERAPDPEWAPFGSFYFFLPLLECQELPTCTLLSLQIAWGDEAAEGTTAAAAAGGAGGGGFAAAAAAARAALASVRPPQPPASPRLPVVPHGERHVPDHATWMSDVSALHDSLAEAALPHSDAAPGGESDSSPHPAYGAGSTPLDPRTNGYASSSSSTSSNGNGNGNGAYSNGNGNGNGVAAPPAAPPSDRQLSSQLAGPPPPDPPPAMSKLVMARRTDFALSSPHPPTPGAAPTPPVDPVSLLTALQERDPRAYQLLLEVGGSTAEGGGPAAFIGSTPERLYVRTGRAVASEAVAGTRPRGAPGDEASDARLALELLSSPKEHCEFAVVREWIREALGCVCGGVTVERPKTLLKQEAVQHLYGRLAGTLREGKTDADLLRSLHPTPAVCGQPRSLALAALGSGLEPFDRGLYSGPFGWIGGDAAEFIVAIRSALVHPSPPSPPSLPPSPPPSQRVSLYAGVGIVKGADPGAEWGELNLKVRQFEKLLLGPPPLRSLPNVNSLWAHVLIEELCRLGVSTFCIAPGSRSSPLTVAAAAHPRARVVSCIDERSLGFYALGHSKGRGAPCAVITSSGTAVANLLPAIVESSQVCAPLVVITADRPPEVRDTGANQTIDQVKIFGPYVRWHCDLPAPDLQAKARVAATAAGAAVRRAMGPIPGPVHINFPCREPLAPTPEAWPQDAILEGLARWEMSDRPFTAPVLPPAPNPPAPHPQLDLASLDPALADLVQRVRGARRGVMVVGGLGGGAEVAAAAALAAALGWPVVADAASGMRVFGEAGSPFSSPSPLLLHHFDHTLLTKDVWEAAAPDVILQVGQYLTSKRVSSFLSWAALKDPTGQTGPTGPTGPAAWYYVSALPARHDPAHALSAHVAMDVASFAATLASLGLTKSADSDTDDAVEDRRRYAALMASLDRAAGAAIEAAFDAMSDSGRLTEPHVARAVARRLPQGHSLYLGNSMPIRDIDMYGGPAPPPEVAAAASPASLAELPCLPGVGVPVGASRGASGIDGVSSAAIGFAEGLGLPLTLLIGDVSFLHDTNGLTLLRGGQGRPPVTIVLVNNGGGGIFSFLPIASSIPSDVFEPLFATPPGVHFPDISRAHALPHFVVQTPEELDRALERAWASQQHSIVEVLVPDRAENLAVHQRVQEAARGAVGRALREWGAGGEEVGAHAVPFPPGPGAPGTTETSPNGAESFASVGGAVSDLNMRGGGAGTSRRAKGRKDVASQSAAAVSDSAPQSIGHLPTAPIPASASASVGQGVVRASRSDPIQSPAASNLPNPGPRLVLTRARAVPFRLPLARPVTTSDAGGIRLGALLAVEARLEGAGGQGDQAAVFRGVGECAPLPGLHKESGDEAYSQLALLSQLLPSTPLTASELLSSSSLDTWLHEQLAVRPDDVAPSTRAALEAALTHVAAAAGILPLSDSSDGRGAKSFAASVSINGLVDGVGSAEGVVAEALALAERGFRTLKFKVGRRKDPREDARALSAASEALQAAYPEALFSLRADANRFWDLDASLTFAEEAAALGLQLEYLEEPCRSLSDTVRFASLSQTRISVALDETLEQVLGGGGGGEGAETDTEPTAALQSILASFPAGAVAAVVAKPSLLGSASKCVELMDVAPKVVVSSAFESAVGIASLALYAAARTSPVGGISGAYLPTAHGLGTLTWFKSADACTTDADFVPSPLERLLMESAATLLSYGASLPLEACRTVLESLAACILEQNDLSDQDDDEEEGLLSFEPRERRYEVTCPDRTKHSLRFVDYPPSSFASPSASRNDEDGSSAPTVVILHGFMGSAEDFAPLASGLAAGGARCICVDLPGHGGSRVVDAGSRGSGDAQSESPLSISGMASAIEALLCDLELVTEDSGLGDGPPPPLWLLGYSLGGRVALNLSQRLPSPPRGVICLSSTLGLEGDAVRQARAAEDDKLAAQLASEGLTKFLDRWYQAPLWASLRASPAFPRLLRARTGRQEEDARAFQGGEAAQNRTKEESSRDLAQCLSAASPGRVPSLWEDLRSGSFPRCPVFFVVGEVDDKFVRIARKAEEEAEGADREVRAGIIPGAGHAAHLERALAVLAWLHRAII